MLIKKLISFFVSTAIIGGSLNVMTITAEEDTTSAEYTAAENDTFKYNIYSDHIELNGLKKGSDPVVIPAEIDGLPVTDWNYNSNLDSVVSRGLSIDENNPNFIIEDDSLICKTSMTLIKYVGKYRKEDHTYTIPDGIKIIANSAFYNALWLEHVNIPDSVEVIGRSAFSITDVDEFHLSKNVKEFSEGAFISFKLSNIEIDPENPYFDIVNGAIMNEAHTELVLIPSYIKVDEFVIPEGVDTIRTNACLNARDIKDLVLPSTYVGDYRFLEHMYGLENVFVSENNPEYTDIDGVLFSKDKRTLLKYPDNKNYRGAYTVPDGTVKIGPLAFYYSDLRDLTFPASVSEMELYSIYTVYHYQGVMTFLNPKVKLSRCLTYFTQSYDHETGETKHLVTVKGYKNSTAASFARDNQANFVELEGEPPKITTTTKPITTTTSSTTSKTTVTSTSTSKTTSETSATSATTSKAVIKFKGDANNDGKLDVADLVTMISFLHGKKTASISAETADINNDKIIDVFDLCSLRKLLLSK